MKRWIWGKTGYAGRYDRQDIKGQPCAVREEGCSLSTGGLPLRNTAFTHYRSKQSYRLMTGIFIALALLQV